MVQPEDRIEACGVRIGHQAGQARVGVAAADQNVHHVMRLAFDAAMDVAAVAEAGVDAAKSLGTAVGSANELGIAERIQVDLIRRYEDIAVIVRAKALRDKQRIVALPVRPVR